MAADAAVVLGASDVCGTRPEDVTDRCHVRISVSTTQVVPDISLGVPQDRNAGRSDLAQCDLRCIWI